MTDNYQWTGEEEPEFDQALGDTYIGKYVLIGITYLDHSGNFLEDVQIHGVIRKSSPKGIEIELKGKRDGETWNMPPALEAIQIAGPGSYRLKTTDELIENPDLLATWTVTYPKEQN